MRTPVGEHAFKFPFVEAHKKFRDAYERVKAVAILEAVDGADVRMIERRERLRFAREPGESIGIAGE